MVLITGGMGFTGLHTARKFLDAGENVVLTRYRAVREPSFIKDEIGKRAIVESLDISNPFDVLDVVRKHQVDHIAHLAVPGLRDLSPAADFQVNLRGLINVLEAGRLSGVRRVTIASSSTVYNGAARGPFREEMPLPVTSRINTEAFKKCFEILGQHYAARTGLDVISMRVAGIWGPLYHTMNNLPSRMVHGAIRGANVDLSGMRGGTPFEGGGHDFTYVKDIAKGIAMLQLAPKLNHRIYNVARGVFTTNSELRAAVIRAVPGIEIALRPGQGPDFRPDAYLDISHLQEDTGYRPDWSTQDAVADYVAWLRAGNRE